MISQGEAEEGSHTRAAGMEAVTVAEGSVLIGAPGRDRESFCGHSTSEKLMLYGGSQVEEPVTGAGWGENAGVGWFREGVIDRGIHFVAGAADAGADGGEALLRACAEGDGHGVQRVGHDATGRAAPAGVRQPDGAVHGINEKDRQAVGCGNAEQQVGSVRDERVASGYCGGAFHTASSTFCLAYADDSSAVGHGRQRQRLGGKTEACADRRPVRSDLIDIGGGGKREVETVGNVCVAQGKTVPKPGQGAQGFGMGERRAIGDVERPGHR